MSERQDQQEVTKHVSLDSAIVAITCATLLYAVSWIMGCSSAPGHPRTGQKLTVSFVDHGLFVGSRSPTHRPETYCDARSGEALARGCRRQTRAHGFRAQTHGGKNGAARRHLAAILQRRIWCRVRCAERLSPERRRNTRNGSRPRLPWSDPHALCRTRRSPPCHCRAAARFASRHQFCE